MSFLRTHMDKQTVQTVCDKIKKDILDNVQDFDYTAFKHFRPEDQTSIQGINVDVKNNVLTLSKMLTFDYVRNNEQYDMQFNTRYQYQMVKMNIEFKIRVLVDTGTVTSVTIESGWNNNPTEIIFGLYIGNEKYLINNTFYDRTTFEADVFQQSTVDKPEPFGLDYVLEIIQKLKV